VLPYSVFVSRRMTNVPGSFWLRYFSFGSQAANIWRSASSGCFAFFGGMSCAFTRATAFFHGSLKAA
jgi:hypothetical protein